MKSYFKEITGFPKTVKLFVITEIILGIGLGIWNLNLNFHIKTLGFGDFELGLIVALGSVTIAVFALPAGYLCQKFGYYRMMLAGCILKATGMFLTALIFSSWNIYLGRVLGGVGDAFMIISSFPYIISLVEEEAQNTVYNLLFAATFFSMFLGNVIGGQLPKVFTMDSYQNSLFISAVIILILAFSRSFLPKSTVQKEADSGIKVFPPINKYLGVYLLFVFLGYIGYFVTTSMLNLILKENYQMNEAFIGFILGISIIASGISLILVSHLVKKWSRHRIATLVIGALLIVYVLMIIKNRYFFSVLIVVSAFLSLMIAGLFDGPIMKMVLEKERGRYSGVKTLVNNIGTAMGIGLAGIIRANFSDYGILFLIGAVLLLIQFLLYFYGFADYVNE